MLKPNRLKKILSEGKVAMGTAIYSNSPAVVEVAGFSGMDFVRIDNEHSWRRDESMEHMMRAAAIAGITPLLRVDKGDPYLIRKALEIGAEGVVIPDIDTQEEVEAVVRAAKFPPRGTRGKGRHCFSARWGAVSDEEWVQWSDQESFIGVMIETDQAVINLEAIMATDGLDFVLFGASDYSMSIGLGKTQRSHPKVQEAIQKTAEMGRKYNKPVSIGVREPYEEDAQKFIKLGYRMIEVGHDLSVLRSSWKNLSAKFKQP